MSTPKTTTQAGRRARGLMRVEVWLDPVIAGALDALGQKRVETRSQTIRAALLLLFQMQEGQPSPVRASVVRTGVPLVDRLLDVPHKMSTAGTYPLTPGAVRVAYWRCTTCGKETLAVKPYKVGDSEPCIFCEEGTAVVEGRTLFPPTPEDAKALVSLDYKPPADLLARKTKKPRRASAKMQPTKGTPS